MTTEIYDYNHLNLAKRKKQIPVPEVDIDQVQQDWIRGLVEQIEFANRPEVLPKYYLHLKITRRRLEP